MFKKLALAALTTSFAVSAMAALGDVEKSVELKDGSTVYVFADGKMGMADRFGRAFSMQPGHTMTTKDGQPIQMVGNEIARVHALTLITP